MSKSHFSRRLAQAKHSASAQRHARVLRALLIQHPAIKDTFNQLPPAVRADAWLGSSDYDASVSIGVTLRDLPGFKAPVLQRAIEPFLSTEWRASTQDYTYDAPNRDFKFTQSFPLPQSLLDAVERHPSARWLRANDNEYMIPRSLSISVNIYAYVKADSPTCRVVVTGVKEEVVRTEVKEIVCA